MVNRYLHPEPEPDESVKKMFASQRQMRFMIAYIEQAMLSQISTYRPELSMPLNRRLGTPRAEYLVAGAGFALAYHGIVERFTDIDICPTDNRFAEAFMESDCARARHNGIEVPEKRLELISGCPKPIYQWAIDPESHLVYSYLPEEAETSMGNLIPIDFSLPPMQLRNSAPAGIFTLEELYGQYAWLVKDGPPEHRDKYTQRLALVGDAMLKKFSRSFGAFCWPS